MNTQGELVTDPLRLAFRNRAARGLAAAVMVATCVKTVATIAIPHEIGQCVSGLTEGSPGLVRDSLSMLVVLLASSIVASAASGLASAARQARVTQLLRASSGERVVYGSFPSGHPRLEAGDVATRILTDADRPASGFDIRVQVVASLAAGAFGVLLLARLDWRLIGVQILGAVLISLTVRRFVLNTSPILVRMRTAQAQVADRLLDARRGAASVRANGQWGKDLARVLSPVPDLHAAGTDMWAAQSRFAWRMGCFLPAMQALAIAAVAVDYFIARLTAGQVAEALGYSLMVLAALDGLEALSEMNAVRVAGARVAEVLALPGTGRADPAHHEADSVLTLHDVVLHHEGRTLLQGANLQLPPGTSLAVLVPDPDDVDVVAESLAGLRSPEAGRIDATSAILAGVRPAWLGATVGGLISLGIDADETRLREAARTARILEVIDSLPNGMNTLLDGLELSGGELQRLGLAQAVIRAPSLIVLRDATGNLDPATEAEVLSALLDVGAQRTWVLITHRPSACRLADRVVRLEGGQLVAEEHGLVAS
jgi:ATP-binding cassette subfamily B protein